MHQQLLRQRNVGRFQTLSESHGNVAQCQPVIVVKLVVGVGGEPAEVNVIIDRDAIRALVECRRDAIEGLVAKRHEWRLVATIGCCQQQRFAEGRGLGLRSITL